ncbi:MAG TPA: molybdate ABC transporter substrate-binding protein [Bryobacteraceae bacterium]|nr:molybdate ABC transporter substrate-binding protein [Bryobacteraceae bacterium]
MLPHICLAILAGIVAITTACRHEQSKPAITVAAAANLTEVFGEIGPRFETETGIHPVFSYGSTAQLARQIESSAPFDVFAAADSEHVADLDRKGLLAPGSRAVYARGVLALWFPAGGDALNGLEDLSSPSVRVVAIAKPDLAPYGEAAVDSLQHMGIWEKVKPKVVYAENISMAKQYGKSKNADAVFTAYSLVLHESGKTIRVDERLHQPIDQELGIVAKSNHQDSAKKFAAFLLHGDGKSILIGYGYNVR